MLECVVNISEGRRPKVIDAIAAVGGRTLLDVHTDPDHNRSVLTMAGEPAELDDTLRAVARETVAHVDLREHEGAHPRLGALDVVPFVALHGVTSEDARAARDRFATWMAGELEVPCFLYGPERTLPDVRAHAFTSLAPDFGPGSPHATAGACCVGERPVLVAYNLWLEADDLALARRIAREVRSAEVRALGLAVGQAVQVSCNLIAPMTVGPDAVFDAVASRAAVARAELVGLVPDAVLRRVPANRWSELDLDEARTIEARLPHS